MLSRPMIELQYLPSRYQCAASGGGGGGGGGCEG
jgi:hypothetical protein